MRASRRPLGRIPALGALSFVIPGAWLLVPSAFTHANAHGLGLASAILAFPDPARFHDTYGQASAVVLGGVARVLSIDVEGVFVANTLVAFAALMVATCLATRIAGRTAGFAALVLGATQPALVISARSEEAHVTAVLFGLLALLFADDLRRRGPSLPVLLATGAATVLCVSSRQTMLPWPALVIAVGFVASPDRAWCRRILALAVVSAAASLPRLAHLLVSHHEFPEYLIVADSFGFGVVPSLFSSHPLFDFRHGLLLLLGGVYGVWRSSGRLSKVLFAGAAAYSMLTLPFDIVTAPGARLGYRLPAIMLTLPLAGAGAATLWQSLTSLPARTAAGVTFAVAILIGPIQGIRHEVLHANPQWAEYVLAREGARKLPAGATVTLGRPSHRSFEPPRFGFPMRAFELVGLRVLPPAGRPADTADYVYSGVWCWTYSLPELLGAMTDRESNVFRYLYGGTTLRSRSAALRLLARDPVAFLAARGVRIPPGPREECSNAVAPDAVFEQWGVVRAPKHELPMVLFSSDVIPVGVWVRPTSEGASAIPVRERGVAATMERQRPGANPPLPARPSEQRTQAARPL